MTEKQYRLKTQHKDGTPTMNSHIGNSLKKSIDGTADSLLGVHHAIERGVVGTYKKIETAFVDKFLEPIPEADEDNSGSKNKGETRR
ncbi:MAG: hypothetical protein LKJ47_01615 [Bifidobacteriaceae bacterium]|jgi:hypothetical protein|nr:hypothetical protein [Bifidobacteriaceae bacterium]